MYINMVTKNLPSARAILHTNLHTCHSKSSKCANIAFPTPLTHHKRPVINTSTTCRAQSTVTTQCQASSTTCSSEQQVILQQLINWAITNGVVMDARIDAQCTDKGERGLFATEAIEAGSYLIVLPLRLALTDQDECHESLHDVFWGLRLAARLLKEQALGEKSAWWSYVQSLPTRVPAPLETFSWEAIKAVELPHMVNEIHRWSWTSSTCADRLPEDALAGASTQQLQWALSVVLSRTFGVAGPDGAVATRMLVPVIDLLNHAGQQYDSSDAVHACDNVQWDVVSPQNSMNGTWEMHLKASRDIGAGQELLLSYGDRDNDEFFLHYGFVPSCNPLDAVTLFRDLDDAAEWLALHREQLFAVSPSVDQLQDRLPAAVEAALQQDVLANASNASVLLADDQIQHEHAKLKLMQRGQVDGRLMECWRVLGTPTTHPQTHPKTHLKTHPETAHATGISVASTTGTQSQQADLQPTATTVATETQEQGPSTGAQQRDGPFEGALEGTLEATTSGRDRGHWSTGLATEEAALLLCCSELLSTMTPLGWDLSWLASQPSPAADAVHWKGTLAAHQQEQPQVQALIEVLGGPCQQLLQDTCAYKPPASTPSAPFDAGDSDISTADCFSPFLKAVTFRAYKKLVLWDTVLALLRKAAPVTH